MLAFEFKTEIWTKINSVLKWQVRHLQKNVKVRYPKHSDYIIEQHLSADKKVDITNRMQCNPSTLQANILPYDNKIPDLFKLIIHIKKRFLSIFPFLAINLW